MIKEAATPTRIVLAFGLLALASVMVIQSVGPNQTAHYASVRAFVVEAREDLQIARDVRRTLS